MSETVLPTFLVIGPPKSGTTWLTWHLGHHPQVFLPMQEPHFFDKDENYKKGLGWYGDFFSGANGKSAIGEKTPNYLGGWGDSDGCRIPERIAKVIPDVRMIAVLRNPVERAISDINHCVRTGRLGVFSSADRLILSRREQLEELGVLSRGRYARWLEAYFGEFRREQILVLFYEDDVVADPLRGLEKVCDFLDIDATAMMPNKDPRTSINKTPQENMLAYRVGRRISKIVPALKDPLRRSRNAVGRILPGAKKYPSAAGLRELYRHYQEENERLSELMGYVPSAWKIDTKS